MIEKQTIAYLRLVHGSYNIIVAALFIYQGWLGLRIRRERLAGVRAANQVRRHRGLGPVIAGLGVLGFAGGLTLVRLYFGFRIKYPLHFLTGLSLAVLIITAFSLSRMIKAADPRWRTPHFIAGLIILCLYTVQIILGLGILF
jgi:hypothetical protein